MGEKLMAPAECYDKLLGYLQRFMVMNRDTFDQIIPFLEIRRFDKKKMILQKGDVDQYLNVVVRGLVRKYVPQSKKGEVTLQLATEGHFVQSEISFYHRTPSEVVLETLEPTTVVSVHIDKLRQAYDLIPEIELLGQAIIRQMFIKKDARYFEQLNKSTRERFLEYINNHPHMLQRVPQKVLASYLNIKPETFSRLKHLLLQKK